MMTTELVLEAQFILSRFYDKMCHLMMEPVSGRDDKHVGSSDVHVASISAPTYEVG